MCCYRKQALLRMVLPAIALKALSAYFSVAICNTGRGRKPQSQYSIRLLAPMDNDKVFIIASYMHCLSIALASPGNEACKRYANRVDGDVHWSLQMPAALDYVLMPGHRI